MIILLLFIFLALVVVVGFLRQRAISKAAEAGADTPERVELLERVHQYAWSMAVIWLIPASQQGILVYRAVADGEGAALFFPLLLTVMHLLLGAMYVPDILRSRRDWRDAKDALNAPQEPSADAS